MTEHKEYTLKKVSDFAKIPSDKIDACLADFKLFIRLNKEINAFGGLGESVLWNDYIAFIWKDDGKTGMSGIEISIEKETAQ